VKFNNFIYRQKQRLVYHFTRNPVAKQIAEINRFSEHIRCFEKDYFIKKLSLHLPRSSFDFIFLRFDLFVSNAERLGGKYKVKDNRLLFSWDDFTVHITNAGDLHIINEIFVEKCYKFRLPGTNHVNVIDIGMNVGLASLYFASLPHVTKVFGFEPFKSISELASLNFSLNTDLSSKIFVKNYGLGDQETVLEASYNEINPGISRSIGQSNIMSSNENHELLTIKEADSEINNILKEYVEDDFIIKIDTEGAEYDIMKSLFRTKLNERIKGFMIEWHDHGSEQLEELLLKENFKLFSFSLKKNRGLVYAFR